ncbi:MAG: septal ring lytic transglycosylase RlpA family protein [Gammaproteobacteria bacterium]
MKHIRWVCFVKVSISLLVMLLLTSCSHMHRKDGPPNFHVDETKIPNAVPKVEPRAKYGNLSTYRVFGKTYHTMPSSKNFQQTGLASWYGTQFHEHRTSSGERYDMLAMTAAHKTLPLPTYLHVTNLKNQRTIIVKVNDRGPFADSRILDLSYVAAKKLGMLGHGTAPVKIEAIDPSTWGKSRDFFLAENKPRVTKYKPIWEAEREQPQSRADSVYLQVGAFKDRSRAQKLQQRLTPLLSMPVHVASPSYTGTLYRVKIGPIKDVATANQITHRLKSLGIKSNKLTGA